MAGNINSCKSIIKLQALIRGYLVRKKFSQMKCDYTKTVKCFEGDDAKVTWRNYSNLCLPIVDRQYSDTRERVDVLTDNMQQKNGCEYVCSGLATGLNDSNSLEESSPIQTCTNDIVTSVYNNSRTENPSVPNADFESTNKLNDSASKDTISSINSWASKGCLHLNKGLDKGLTHKTAERTVNHIALAQENVDQVETDEQTIVDEKNCDVPTEDQILYPNDKTSLVKLREDLTMELLWIEQAIESRISYLTMKENMDKQAKGK